MSTIGVSLAVPEPWGSRLQQFRVANNRMVIVLPERITGPELDKFLKQYKLEGIGVKEFIFVAR